MKAMYKDILREIFKSKTRFLAILLITLLGVMTFIGLNVVSIYQHNTLDILYKKYNSYDLQIKSNIGFSKKNMKKLSNLEEISKIEYAYEKDIYLKNSHKSIKIKSMPKDISRLNIIKGEFLDFSNNILMEYSYKDKYSIGDKILLNDNTILTISGFYENIENRLIDSKDISYLGHGFAEFTVYISEKYFKNEDFNIANIKINGTENLKTYEKKYFEKVFSLKNKIKNILLEDENNLIKFKENLSLEIKKGLNELTKAKNLINKNEKKLLLAKKKYENSFKLLNDKEKEFKNAPDKFKIGFEKIEENLNKLKKENEKIKLNEEKINDGFNKINLGLKEIKLNEEKIKLAEKEIKKNKEKVFSLKPTIFLSRKKIDTFKQKVNDAEKEILENKKVLELEYNKIKLEEKNIIDAKIKLENGKKEIKDALDKINFEKEKLLKKEKEYYTNFEKNKKIFLDNRKKIKENEIKLKKAFEKFNVEKKKALLEINDNKNKIENSQREIDSIKSIFLINDRNDNLSFRTFNEGIASLKIISKIFPVIFYLIVILVITTILTRMIDEQRNNIGTYKFLGYNNRLISLKYIFYGIIPTIIGIILGIYGGTYIFPRIIYKGFNAGSILSYDKLYIYLNYKYIFISVIISILSTLFSIWISIKVELNSNVADILKEKPPKNASNILLEKIPFIWNNINFFNKITLRNIFRYKTRMILNILGISGCASLIFFSFAIKNSLSGISEIQFNKLHKYNLEINLKSHLNNTEIKSYLKKFDENNIYPIMKLNAKFQDINKKESNIIIYVINDSKKIANFVNFLDKKNKKIELNDEGAILSERALNLMNKNLGDYIIVKDIYNRPISLKIKNTFKNYFSHYIFMTKSYYEKLNLDEFKINTILLDEKIENYDKLFENDMIQNISLNTNHIKIFNKITNSLNFIILFIITISATLSIIVTYSLLEINVNERKKELATIKVLGFYHNELTMYIFKEVIIMSIVGILFGFLLGNILTNIVIDSLSKTDTVLLENYGFTPYIYSTILTLLFSIVSMLLIQFNLKKINMVEALKSE